MTAALATPCEACAHCALPIEGAPVVVDARSFCCRGCAAAHDLLHRRGLGRYYELRASSAAAAGAVDADRPRSLAWLEGAPPRVLAVAGLECAACVWTVERLFECHGGAPGGLRVDPIGGVADLLEARGVDLRSFVEDCAAIGVDLAPAGGLERGGDDALALRMTACLVLAGNTMLFAGAFYFGLDEGPFHALLQRGSMAATALAVLVGGVPLVRAAARSLRRGVVHLDLPIALGVGLGFAAVLLSFVTTGRAEHADVLTAFIALMLLGRWLQSRALRRARRAAGPEPLLEALPVRVEREGRVSEQPAAEVVEGDVLVLARGELLVVRARADADLQADLSWIDGESEPRTFTAGEEVPAGAFLLGDATARLVALEPLAASALPRLLQARGDRRPGSERFAMLYVASVLVAALAAALFAPAERVLSTVAAVLVVTCPCALGIARPLARALATARLRQRGFMLRDPDVLRRLAAVRRLVLDKTGTLTDGVVVETCETLVPLRRHERSALATLVAHSAHPRARALATWIAGRPEAWPVRPGARVRETPGVGVAMQAAGQRYTLGREGERGLVFSRHGAGGRVTLAVFETQESLRPGVARWARELRRRGTQLVVASGDRRARVAAVAEALGIEAHHGELDPEAKAALVRADRPGATLMLGDGINDALAMAEAAVAGTPAVDRPFVASRSDFWLTTPGLGPLVAALDEAARASRTERVLERFAVVYNLVALVVAALGGLSAVLVAVAMPLSSLAALAFVLVRHRPTPSNPRALAEAGGTAA